MLGIGPQQRSPRLVPTLPASGVPGDFIYVQATSNSYIADNAGDYQILDTGSGDIGGSTGSTDNAILRADGTGGKTLQSSGIIIDDSSNLSGVASFTSAAANPADAGAIRLGNTEIIAWENATPGTDLTLGVNASNILASTAPLTAPTVNSVANYAVDAVGTDSYAITPSPAIAALTDGLIVSFKANVANTGAATLAVSGLTAKAIVKSAGGLSTVLADNDIRAGQIVIVQYSSVADNFQIQSTLGNAGGGSGANTVTTSVLLSSTSVDLNEGTGAKQTLYTCPASRRAIVTNIVMQKFSGTVGALTAFGIGWDAAADDVTPGNILSLSGYGFAANAVILGIPDVGGPIQFINPPVAIGTAGGVLGLKVTTPEGSALTVIADVYGYLTDTSGVPTANVNGTGDGAAIAPASVTTTNGIGVGVAAPSAGLNLDKTVTAGGTTGAQTINKPSGTVNFAAAATSLVVTNSLITTSSIIQCTVGTNDTTMKSVQCVAGSGSFTIYPNAAPTAETRVNFTLTN